MVLSGPLATPAPDGVVGTFTSRHEDARARDVTGDGLPEVLLEYRNAHPEYRNAHPILPMGEAGGSFREISAESRLKAYDDAWVLEWHIGIGGIGPRNRLGSGHGQPWEASGFFRDAP